MFKELCIVGMLVGFIICAYGISPFNLLTVGIGLGIIGVCGYLFKNSG